MDNGKSGQAELRFKIVTGIIIFGALCRLIPHPANFTPIAAMALFGGTYLMNKKYAIAIPLLAMFISDLLMQLFTGNGFYAEIPFVYGSIILISMLGFLLRGREQRQTIMVASLTGSILFFLITNFGTWASGYYGYTSQGLMNAYIAAIPFFRGTLMGDLFYNLLFFGGFALVRATSLSLLKKKI